MRKGIPISLCEPEVVLVALGYGGEGASRLRGTSGLSHRVGRFVVRYGIILRENARMQNISSPIKKCGYVSLSRSGIEIKVQIINKIIDIFINDDSMECKMYVVAENSANQIPSISSPYLVALMRHL